MKNITIITLISIIILFLLGRNNSMKNSKNEDISYSFEESLNTHLSELHIDNINCIDIKGDTTMLLNLISSDILIYYYSDLHCSSCYEKQLRTLAKYFYKSEQNVIVLCSYMSFQNFKVSMNRNEYKFPIYYINYKAFNSLVIHYETPLFFTLNSELEASNFYIFYEENLENNHKYFQKVKTLIGN